MLKKITADIFYISLITYVVYLGLEFLKEGLISNYLDLNILLIVVVVSGIAIIKIQKSINS